MNHFGPRLLLALIVRFAGGQGSLLSAHVDFDSAWCHIRIGPRGTSTPNLPTGSSPKGEHGRAPLQSRRVL